MLNRLNGEKKKTANQSIKQSLLIPSMEDLGPILHLRNLNPADILIQIEDEFECIPRSQIRQRCLGNGESSTRLCLPTGRGLGLGGTRHGEEFLEDFVCRQSETELR